MTVCVLDAVCGPLWSSGLARVAKELCFLKVRRSQIFCGRCCSGAAGHYECGTSREGESDLGELSGFLQWLKVLHLWDALRRVGAKVRATEWEVTTVDLSSFVRELSYSSEMTATRGSLMN